MKSLFKVDSTCAHDKGAMYVLATAHLQHWKNESNAFLNCMLMVDESWMQSFDPQLK